MQGDRVASASLHGHDVTWGLRSRGISGLTTKETRCWYLPEYRIRMQPVFGRGGSPLVYLKAWEKKLGSRNYSYCPPPPGLAPGADPLTILLLNYAAGYAVRAGANGGTHNCQLLAGASAQWGFRGGLAPSACAGWMASTTLPKARAGNRATGRAFLCHLLRIFLSATFCRFGPNFTVQWRSASGTAADMRGSSPAAHAT